MYNIISMYNITMVVDSLIGDLLQRIGRWYFGGGRPWSRSFLLIKCRQQKRLPILGGGGGGGGGGSGGDEREAFHRRSHH